ncbi:MAG: TRIC cation channel family protein, partial [Pseudomonadota bacterium]
MTPELLITLADRLGVFVFALSGGVVAVRKDMDLLGIIVLAFLPAIGGGTLRDVLLDQPVFWLTDTVSLLLACLG